MFSIWDRITIISPYQRQKVTFWISQTIHPSVIVQKGNRQWICSELSYLSTLKVSDGDTSLHRCLYPNYFAQYSWGSVSFFSAVSSDLSRKSCFCNITKNSYEVSNYWWNFISVKLLSTVSTATLVTFISRRLYLPFIHEKPWREILDI